MNLINLEPTAQQKIMGYVNNLEKVLEKYTFKFNWYNPLHWLIKTGHSAFRRPKLECADV
jgi:hypothetical protein